MKRLIIVPLLCLTLIGCSRGAVYHSANTYQSDPRTFGPKPENYKVIIKECIQKTFYDPHSLRDVSISNPKMGNAIIDEGWIVCLKANGKNLYGAYTGLKETAYVIKFGKVTFVTKKSWLRSMF